MFFDCVKNITLATTYANFLSHETAYSPIAALGSTSYNAGKE
jgi:hypothetical protein